MERVVSTAVIAVVVCLASCGGHATDETAEADSLRIDTVAVLDESLPVSVVNAMEDVINSGDASQMDFLMGRATEDIKQLLTVGDTVAVDSYVSKIREFFEANKDTLQSLNVDTTVINNFVQMVERLSGNLTDAAIFSLRSGEKKQKADTMNEAKKTLNSKTDEAGDEVEEKVE